MSKPPLVFSPLTRWVLMWPNGEHVRDFGGPHNSGPLLYATRASARNDIWLLSQADGQPKPKPVKVRVTIEVAK